MKAPGLENHANWIPLSIGAVRPTQMKDSPYRDCLVDVMEELYKFTLLTRDLREFLIDRYSERREASALEQLRIP